MAPKSGARQESETRPNRHRPRAGSPGLEAGTDAESPAPEQHSRQAPHESAVHPEGPQTTIMAGGTSDGKPRFTVAAKPMQLRPGLDPTKLRELDDALEVERHRALTARLARGSGDPAAQAGAAPATLPLAGVRVVVTRARAQAAEMVARLDGLGAEAIEVPTIAIAPPEDPRPLDAACDRIETFDWVVFTSVNAVSRVAERLQTGAGGVRGLEAARLCAVGAATAEALAGRGLRVDLVPDEYRAEGVIRALRGQGDLTGVRVLLPRANLARDLLPAALRKAGADVTAVTAYRTVPADLDPGGPDIRRMLRERRVDVVTFTSGSSVRNFVRAVGGAQAAELLRRVDVACIGPVTAEAAGKLNIATTIMPAESTVPALIEAIVERFGDRRNREEEA